MTKLGLTPDVGSAVVREILGLFAVAALICLTPGCSSAEPKSQSPANSSTTQATPTPTSADTAQTAAESIRAAVPEVVDLVTITEANDPNNLIGRPNGYVAATVIIDSRLECPPEDLGAGCGATVEQWRDHAAAQMRADYIQKSLQSMPMLGTEWTTVRGSLVLRVSGKLTPSAADVYTAAFERRS